MTKKKKKPYYPNNWKAIAGSRPEWFDSIPYDVFMDWKIGGYEIPSSIACIIREQNLKTGKVSEHVYQQPSAAKNKCKEIMSKGESEFIVCDDDQLTHMTPRTDNDYEDNYDPFT